MFWIMLALNLLSLVLGWMTRNYTFSAAGTILIMVFAVGNAALGTYLAWRLVNS
jgi:hypothetical protein